MTLTSDKTGLQKFLPDNFDIEGLPCSTTLVEAGEDKIIRG